MTIITDAEDKSDSHDDSPTGPSRGSDMLFGASAVQAALQSKKRSFQQLYTFGDHELKQLITGGAQKLEIDCIEVDNRGVLNNFTASRPHNGFVLECSPLPEINVSCLGSQDQNWQPVLEHSDPMCSTQSLVDIPHRSRTRHPIYILLDEVVSKSSRN